ncbi:MAG: PHP domain-containing protein [Candidatus Omnitrophica bacterium]|nr:PHP domain-containing protein [Candidatus Omnitrophota bacterium]
MEKVDIHIHSCFDDGASEMTINNIIKEAKNKKLTKIGIVIHYHKFLPSKEYKLYGNIEPEKSKIKLRKLIKDLDKINDASIQIKLGIETEIIDTDGNLNCYDEIFEKVDYILCACHWLPDEILPSNLTILIYKDREKAIQYYKSYQYKKIIDNFGRERIIEKYFLMYENLISKYPGVILSHPHFGELAVYQIIENLEQVKNYLYLLSEKMEKNKISFNITEPMVSLIETPEIDNCGIKKSFWSSLLFWINICKEKKIEFIPGSDAHNLEGIGKVDGCYRLIG